MKPDTKFCIASLTKQFTSVLIMQLNEQGKIDLHATISRYLPWYRKDVGEQVTIHQLLSHTGGLGEYTERPDFFSTISKATYNHKEFVLKYCSDSLQTKPGVAFRYTNTGYYILGTIIEEITGQSYGDILQKQILNVAGMNNTGMAETNTGGQTVPGYYYQLGNYEPAECIALNSSIFAAGGMYSTVQDLYQWDSTLNAGKILNEVSRKLLFTPVMANYAYGFGVVKNMIFHQGAINGFRSFLTRVTDEQEVIILLSNNFDIDLNPINNSIYAILHGQHYQLPRQPVAMAMGKQIRTVGIKKAVAFFKGKASARTVVTISKAQKAV